MPARPRGPGPSPLLAFAAVLGLMIVSTAACHAARSVPEPPIALAERPMADYYVAHDRGGHVDHHALYFGIDREALEAMRRADVIFFGNSRLMYAARPGVFDRFFAARNLRYYILGFGLQEADLFPLAIMERFDLRPRIAIVNADGFFLHLQSQFAEEVMRDTAFGARKRQFEAEQSHRIRQAFHRIAPHWLDLYRERPFPTRPELIIYRSRSTGAWQTSPWAAGTRPVADRDLRSPRLAPHELPAARYFKEALDRRRTRLVLTYVPTPRPLGGGPALIADALAVPLIAPYSEGLRTEDDDHLDESSAVIWSEAFLREFARAIP